MQGLALDMELVELHVNDPAAAAVQLGVESKLVLEVEQAVAKGGTRYDKPGAEVGYLAFGRVQIAVKCYGESDFGVCLDILQRLRQVAAEMAEHVAHPAGVNRGAAVQVQSVPETDRSRDFERDAGDTRPAVEYVYGSGGGILPDTDFGTDVHGQRDAAIIHGAHPGGRPRIEVHMPVVHLRPEPIELQCKRVGRQAAGEQQAVDPDAHPVAACPAHLAQTVPAVAVAHSPLCGLCLPGFPP